MKKIKPHARIDRTITVRHDKRRAKKRSNYNSYSPKYSDKTGDWEKWWREGCGVSVDTGEPLCPPGHAYHVERYRRAEHRRIKILQRRKERRRLNRLDYEE